MWDSGFGKCSNSVGEKTALRVTSSGNNVSGTPLAPPGRAAAGSQ